MIPFNVYKLNQIFEMQHQKINIKIEQYTNDEIMANNLELLANNCFEEFHIEPVFIGDEELNKRSIVQKKIKKYIPASYRFKNDREYIDVDGFEAKFYFPYTGEDFLFKSSGNTYIVSGYPDIDLHNNFIFFTYQVELRELQNENDKERLLVQLDRDLAKIKSSIGTIDNEVNDFNGKLQQSAMNLLIERKKRVEQYYAISQMFEVPLQRTEFATKHIPMERKIVPISTKYNNEQSFCISDNEYIFILDTIKHNGSTYERTPSSYKSMHEEDLRNTLLAALNGMYLGNATGETFRNNGKTDICIEKNNRAAFVAECKIWTGQGTVANAINQLDRYLTWRDCKTELIFFVRNKDFLNVLKLGKQALESMLTIRQIKEIDKNEFNCSLASEINPGQLVNVRVIFFNLYSQ